MSNEHDDSEATHAPIDGESEADRQERERDSWLKERLEGIVPGVVKKAMLSGLGAIVVTEETIRSAVTDAPKEAMGYVLSQADNTKDQFLGLVAAEVRDFLREMDIETTLARVLSTMTMQINTEIKFSPTQPADSEQGDVEPEVKTDVTLKRTRKKKKD